MAEKSSDASHCPLCGADNQCAIAAGNPPETCWCYNNTLDADVAAEAAAITDAQCVCPACGLPEKTEKQ